MRKCKHLNYMLTEEVRGYSSYTFKNGQWLDDANSWHSDLTPSGLIIFDCLDCKLHLECRKKLPKYIQEKWNMLQDAQAPKGD